MTDPDPVARFQDEQEWAFRQRLGDDLYEWLVWMVEEASIDEMQEKLFEVGKG
jgi:hypothetical protein